MVYGCGWRVIEPEMPGEILGVLARASIGWSVCGLTDRPTAGVAVPDSPTKCALAAKGDAKTSVY